MLALYIGFALGLPRPYWAMTTAYIVSQPLAGRRALQGRLSAAGHLLGAAAAVAMVPNLVNAPVLLCLAMALWVGGCLTVSLLDRTPRSYILMLAGYTAAIIGFPSVNQPGGIFEVAVSRAVEIGLGILCATLVHSLVFPRPVGTVLRQRLAAWLGEADRLGAGRAEGTGRRRPGPRPPPPGRRRQRDPPAGRPPAVRHLAAARDHRRGAGLPRPHAAADPAAVGPGRPHGGAEGRDRPDRPRGAGRRCRLDRGRRPARAGPGPGRAPPGPGRHAPRRRLVGPADREPAGAPGRGRPGPGRGPRPDGAAVRSRRPAVARPGDRRRHGRPPQASRRPAPGPAVGRGGGDRHPAVVPGLDRLWLGRRRGRSR
jgi:hypothetical protein